MKILTVTAVASAIVCLSGCAAPSADAEFFGKVEPPDGQVLRYISGSEPSALDPQVGTGQPETRIHMALFEGLTDYDPKTSQPIPAIAERWDVNNDSSVFVFHLRSTARWSNGDPITAHDFVYSLRRGLEPALASQNAYMAYYIVNAEGYNSGGVFARDPGTGAFVLEKDVTGDSQLRLVLPGAEDARAKQIAADPKLRKAVAGKAFVPIRAEDIGVEALDDYTLRITLIQPAPFFVGMMAHHFFMVLPKAAIEKYGVRWTQPGNIITSGAFTLKEWRPYDRIVVTRNPLYWDAATVKLDEIRFYPIEDQTTMMNLYKAGEVDATYNHTVPAAWLPIIKKMKDYMDAPEIAIEYYVFNTTKPPMDDKRVRKAFNMAIDKDALARFRVVAKPLTAFTPEGIFPGYTQPKGDAFNVARARELLAEAGFRDAAGQYDPTPSRRATLKSLQHVGFQSAGRGVRPGAMEAEPGHHRAASQHGVPHFSRARISNTRWPGRMDRRLHGPIHLPGSLLDAEREQQQRLVDPAYVRMLEDANRTLDPSRRYELLAKAEAYLLEAQAVVPLLTRSTDFMKKPYVKGMYPNPATVHAWKFVYIEHDPAKWDNGMPDMRP